MAAIGLGLPSLSNQEHLKMMVWNKGRIIARYDPSIWRQDDFGQVIRYGDYGNESSPYGWEIDHIVATALGGSDDLSNLRPLHCRKNASLGGGLGNLLTKR